ncbi:MarR family winged helix-turn-helix transcriptional regulator [Actinomadura sp. NEAU-AAG7]|uniref:MarR family winged helix-turn-helix transcriptional regulator n=1 Tax=Actinomadura sp. NEAU-AAG7 TaxID=2839640 RepID=UPI001BE4E04A|nr:MarR family winged helix-turn-helix transcriptional regulator [Actinomadura sp. NEAU-AAG7]MBT2208299.1 MarR family winged helix-turn-helix transcriptional regulator [Actinomadura sp. NEAU-AAG7]
MATETSATERSTERSTERPAERPAGHPPPEADPVLAEIGVALFHLRRVWAKPDLMKRIRAQTSGGPGGRPLQISNLMVVNAIAALTAEAGEERKGPAPDEADCACEVTVGAVAERLEVDPSTASRLVGHAIDAGLVSRRPSPVDARRANLGLTPAGRRVKQVSERFRRAYLDELMAGWSEGERSEFARLLTRFADAAAARAPMYPDGIDQIFEEAGAE